MGPRMYRVTLRSPLKSLRPSGGTEYGFATAPDHLLQPDLLPKAAIDRIFRSSGGIQTFASDLKDDPVSLQSTTSVVSDRLTDGSLTRATSYTWMATLCPSFTGGRSYRQSVIIIKDRLPPAPTRNNDILALQKNSYAITDADENPNQERLTWVGSNVGFSGGAGGDIRIFGSTAIDTDVLAGQWVMLSRQPHSVTGPPVVLEAVGPAVHRWFRVLRVGELDLTTPSNFPHGGTGPTWSRLLTLAGPDWAFQDEATGSNTSAIDDTFCTLISGAVSVVESEVVIND